MADASPGKDEFSTIIGADAQFKGDLTFQGGVRIDGQFEGTIQTSGRVLVSKGGRLKAEVKAGGIAIEGQVDGNLSAEDRLELRGSAQVRGDVKASKLLVVEGATLIGRCEVGPVGAGAGHEARPTSAPIPSRPSAALAGAR